MKKAILILISLMMVLPLSSRKLMAQDEKEYKFTLKTNPLAAAGGPIWVAWVIPVTGEYKVYFETKTIKKQSFQVGASYLAPSIFISALKEELDSSNSFKVNGYRLQGWYKFFLTRDSNGPAGFYVGPHFSFANARLSNADDADDYVDATKININGVFGYQLITSGGFALDIFTGVGLRSMSWDYASETSTSFDIWDSKSQVNVTLGMSFGYAF